MAMCTDVNHVVQHVYYSNSDILYYTYISLYIAYTIPMLYQL